MDKYELDDIIFDCCCEVLYNNGNWIEYGNLLLQIFEKLKEKIPLISIDEVEKWIKECIANDYISVARHNADELNANDLCRGEWLGLDDEE